MQLEKYRKRHRAADIVAEETKDTGVCTCMVYQTQ